MSMSMGPSEGEDEVVSTINTTPLVDVMLVLLIIFLITIPVVNYSIAVSLPKERNEVRESKPENIVVSVDLKGNIYWYDAKVATTQQLVERLKKVSMMTPQPEVHIRADLDANYDSVGKIVYACQRAAIAKVSFITEPPPRG
ncbi:MAG: biopolymer transporter ExbD [Burkholderiales bacterium]|nr:biopolymer transporter ExbD [Burkholderiales bacterium]